MADTCCTIFPVITPDSSITPVVTKDGNITPAILPDSQITVVFGDGYVNPGSGGMPGGANTQVQFNNNGAFGGSAGLTWDGALLGTNTVSSIGTAALSLRSTTGIRIGDNFANFISLTGNGAGLLPSISSQGSDANINLVLYGKGTGGLQIGTLANATPIIAVDAATPTALTPGTTGQVLTSAGANKTPYWSTLAASAVSVNSAVVSNPNFLNNATSLGLDYSVAGSNITASLRLTDVQTVADARIALNIGSISSTPTPSLPFAQLGGSVVSDSSNWVLAAVNIASGSYAVARAALIALGATPNASSAGGLWTLPQAPLYVTNMANPSASQYGRVASIDEGVSSSLLIINMTATNSYLDSLPSGAQPIFISTAAFTFQAAPANAIKALASSVAPASPLLINLGQAYNADNVGLIVRVVSTTPTINNAVGTINNNADYGALTITSTPYPPTIPAGYNQNFVGISDSTNTLWAGFGRLTASGIEQIAWIKPPTSNSNFTGGKIWIGVNEIASVYSATDLNTAQTVAGPVTSILTPELTHTYSDDGLGGRADTITVLPFLQLNAVTSLNTGTGDLALTSSDGTIAINKSGQNIDLKGQATGGAGVATGYNIGDYVQGNIATFAGAPDGSVETQNNEGSVQIGSGTGYSTNSQVIQKNTGQQGWSFGGQTVTNFVAELGAQKQTFRFGISGNWNINNLAAYGTSPGSSVLIPPIFIKEGTDYNTTGAQFPGFTNATNPYVPFNATSAVTATARYSLDLGKTVSNVAAVSTATVASTTVFVTLVTVNNVTNITQAPVSLPLEAQVGGVWVYIGTEWNISNIAGNVLQLTLSTILATLTVGTPVRIQNNATTPLIAWLAGVPQANTSFGTATTSTTGNGYLEITVSSNTWTLDSYNYQPTGFTLPTSTSRYNLTWSAFMPGIVNVNSVQYWMYNNSADSFNSPNALTQWNNRFTANFGGVSTQQNLQSVTAIGNSTNLGIAFNDTQATPKSVTLGVPSAVTTSYALKLPAAQGAAQTYLQNDGSGNLSWGAGGSGSNTTVYSTIPYKTSGGGQGFSYIEVYSLLGTNLATCQSFFPLNSTYTINRFFGTTTRPTLTVTGAVTQVGNNFRIPTSGLGTFDIYTGDAAIIIRTSTFIEFDEPLILQPSNSKVGLEFDNTLALSTTTGVLQLAQQNANAGQSLVWNGTTWAPYIGWLSFSVTCRYNTGVTPVTGVSATFTVPSATVTGTVHYYIRYTAAGASAPVYRFVPNTDSALTSLSYDSFWSSFSGGVLSSLITQRGIL